MGPPWLRPAPIASRTRTTTPTPRSSRPSPGSTRSRAVSHSLPAPKGCREGACLKCSVSEAGRELFYTVPARPDQPRGYAAIDAPRGERLLDQRESTDGGPFPEGHPAKDHAMGSHDAVPPEADTGSLDITQLLWNDRAGEPLT